MREVFEPKDRPRDPGRVFYTIRHTDIGKQKIVTTVGPVNVGDLMGGIMRHDVGKRIYRVPNEAGDWWYWQVENEQQFAERIEKGKWSGD